MLHDKNIFIVIYDFVLLFKGSGLKKSSQIQANNPIPSTQL